MERYTLTDLSDRSTMVPKDSGRWVMFDDAQKELKAKEDEITRLRELLRDNDINPDGEDEDPGPDPESICPTVQEYFRRLEQFVAEHPGATILSCDVPSHRLIGACAYIKDPNAEDGEIVDTFFVPFTAMGKGPKMANTPAGRNDFMTRIAAGETFSDKME